MYHLLILNRLNKLNLRVLVLEDPRHEPELFSLVAGDLPSGETKLPHQALVVEELREVLQNTDVGSEA